MSVCALLFVLLLHFHVCFTGENRTNDGNALPEMVDDSISIFADLNFSGSTWLDPTNSSIYANFSTIPSFDIIAVPSKDAAPQVIEKGSEDSTLLNDSFTVSELYESSKLAVSFNFIMEDDSSETATTASLVNLNVSEAPILKDDPGVPNPTALSLLPTQDNIKTDTPIPADKFLETAATISPIQQYIGEISIPRDDPGIRSSATASTQDISTDTPIPTKVFLHSEENHETSQYSTDFSYDIEHSLSPSLHSFSDNLSTPVAPTNTQRVELKTASPNIIKEKTTIKPIHKLVSGVKDTFSDTKNISSKTTTKATKFPILSKTDGRLDLINSSRKGLVVTKKERRIETPSNMSSVKKETFQESNNYASEAVTKNAMSSKLSPMDKFEKPVHGPPPPPLIKVKGGEENPLNIMAIPAECPVIMRVNVSACRAFICSKHNFDSVDLFCRNIPQYSEVCEPCTTSYGSTFWGFTCGCVAVMMIVGTFYALKRTRCCTRSTYRLREPKLSLTPMI